MLVPIKGYHYEDYELPQIMHLDGKLYFIVEKQYKTYDFRYKKEFFRFTWDELVNFVETTPLSTKAYRYGGKGNTDWGKYLLRNIESSLSNYDKPLAEIWADKVTKGNVSFEAFAAFADTVTKK